MPGVSGVRRRKPFARKLSGVSRKKKNSYSAEKYGGNRALGSARPRAAIPGAARWEAAGRRASTEIQQEKRRARLPRNQAKGIERDAAIRVRIARVPARELDVVVKHVADVPAEDHVAKAQSRLRRREKLLAADIFTAQRAVDVERAQLDAPDVVLLESRLTTSSSVIRAPPKWISRWCTARAHRRPGRVRSPIVYSRRKARRCRIRCTC